MYQWILNTTGEVILRTFKMLELILITKTLSVIGKTAASRIAIMTNSVLIMAKTMKATNDFIGEVVQT